MSDNRFTPPVAPTSLAEPPRWRSPPVAAAVGMLSMLIVSVAISLVLELVLGVDLASEHAEVELNRRLRASGHYFTISIVWYAFAAMVGGWSAGRLGRRSWPLAGLSVSIPVLVLVSTLAYARFGTLSAEQLLMLLPMLPASLAGAFLARTV